MWWGINLSTQMAPMVSSVIKGTDTIGEAFKKMGQNMLNYFIDSLSKMAMNMALFGQMMSPTSMGGMFGRRGIVRASWEFIQRWWRGKFFAAYAWGDRTGLPVVHSPINRPTSWRVNRGGTGRHNPIREDGGRGGSTHGL